MTRRISYAMALNEAVRSAMENDSSVIVIGEGVPDAKGIFGTTGGLREQFGYQRVFDMPLAENAVTGVCVGAALSGMKPVLVHQRIDFSLLAMDQIVNTAAKWYYTFNGQQSVPMTIRMIIGRGWGQGPQHSQSLQALFAHIPGLRVVLPATPRDAKGLLLAAIEDPNPVVVIEHRWLHSLVDEVPTRRYMTPLSSANISRLGTDITVAAYSYMLIEALRAEAALRELGILVEVIDMRSANPIDEVTLVNSVKKTRRFLALDTGWSAVGLASELVSIVSANCFDDLLCAPRKIAAPNHPVATASILAAPAYSSTLDIVNSVLDMMGSAISSESRRTLESKLLPAGPIDVPSVDFTGPF